MKTSPFLLWCRRYLTVPFFLGLGVIIFLICFNENNVMKYYEYDTEIDRLNREIATHNDTIQYYRELNRRLSTDRAELEKIVREKYYMQRTNEDVYVFVDE